MKPAVLLLLSSLMFAADPISKMYDDQLNLVEKEVLALARAMPAEKYNFAPQDGTFKGVRTFGEQVKHVATMIYMTSALVLGEPSPYGPGTRDNGPDSIQTKDQIVKYFEDSLAYARKAVNSVTVANQLDSVRTYFGPMPKIAVASGLTYHTYNHYGQMVVYARMNGIVPPASR